MLRFLSIEKYDETKRNKAFGGLGLRVLVAGYMCYLAYMIASGYTKGETTMQPWLVLLFCGIFTVGAAVFAVYAVKSFIGAMRSAEIKAQPSAEEEQDEA